MTTLALIPARGGSKGVPRKNLRVVGCMSLLERAIRSAQGVSRVEHILVSTDDEEIAAEARRCGVDVPFLRPPELASDHAAVIPAILHALDSYERFSGTEIETLVLLEPTSPFRTALHVAAALELYAKGGCATVISVCPLERKPENIFLKSNGVLDRYIRDPLPDFTRRQDMSALCRLNSAIYVTSTKRCRDEGRLLAEPVGYVEMSSRDSVNIDEEVDLMLAEAIASRYGI